MKRLVSSLFILAAGLFATGCESDVSGVANVLSGTITVGGVPASEVTLVAIGPDGVEATGLTDGTGKYRIENPPKGALRFRLGSQVPPPPPGVQAPPPPPDAANIPAKYRTAKNELTFEYTGGKQTYDFDLKK